MRKLINKLYRISLKLMLTLKALRKFYRNGGYTGYTIAKIDYGKILADKTVLVTGGSSGIGLSIAKKFIEQGATVVITGRDKEKLSKAADDINNSRLIEMVWDIGEVGKTETMLDRCLEHTKGKLDILINNAGLIGNTSFLDVTEKNWDEVYRVNSKGLYFLTQAVCKYWISGSEKKTRKVINITSQGGYVGATYPYRMTKWDIAGLTQGLGIKMANSGIIINGIAPGIIATAMQPGLDASAENIFIPSNPVERFGFTDEIAELALFLSGDAANFIVGQTIVCDGGFSIK